MLLEIQDAAERGGHLTRQLLVFSRKSVPTMQVTSIHRLVTQMERMLRLLLGADIVLSLALREDAGSARVDTSQVEQVLMNLVVNARDAMPAGGRILISTHAATVDATMAQAHANAHVGRYVVLEVRDTGTGMDAESMSRIFEPFFTTKAEGKGTGLGLAVVFGIVHQSDGFIRVESVVGQGTSFLLYFPVADASAAVSLGSAPVELARGTETVLLVEDEAGLRRLLRNVLMDQGYRVLDAGTGTDALDLAAEHLGRIDLLLTDVVLPGISGRQLMQSIRRDAPRIKVLMISGYTDQALAGHGVAEENVNLLQKPFSPLELVRRVRAVLDAD